ncbi:hypothetical protein TNCV_3829481 [Trichonephila clavipes]|nr:hypothetical protein TNCV_3829481 [Trichonephila clavipes]
MKSAKESKIVTSLVLPFWQNCSKLATTPAHEIHHGKELHVRLSLVVALSSIQYNLAQFHPNFEGEHPKGGLGVYRLSSPFINLARGLAAQRLFRVTPCRKRTIHLQTSTPFQGFKPKPYCTVVSVANHCAGWATSYSLLKNS